MMQRWWRAGWRWWLFVIFSVALSGCETTINKANPIIETLPDVAAARVYFIRPFTYRERGIADNPVSIEFNNSELLKLAKGEYTMLRIKPEKGALMTRNRTRFTNKDEPIEMTRSVPLDLAAGKTYFIHIKQVNEEFRGVYYVPIPVDLKTAQSLIMDVRAIGDARSAPIGDLTGP